MGVFGAPQGVRGQIRVKSHTRDAMTIGGYGPLTDAARSRDFVFEFIRHVRDDIVVASLRGVDTREAAAALTGVEIFARRDQLPRPSEDEFYYDDLVGLEAVDASGARLGRVVSLMNYGAGDILEIEPESGGETLLMPFTRAVAPTIDFESGRIVIEPPEEVEGARPRSARRRSQTTI